MLRFLNLLSFADMFWTWTITAATARLRSKRPGRLFALRSGLWFLFVLPAACEVRLLGRFKGKRWEYHHAPIWVSFAVCILAVEAVKKGHQVGGHRAFLSVAETTNPQDGI